jgi:hypothetical protein
MADTTQQAVQELQGKKRSEPTDDTSRNAAQGSQETRGNDGPAEKAEGEINPSSPGNTGTTPGSNAKLG